MITVLFSCNGERVHYPKRYTEEADSVIQLSKEKSLNENIDLQDSLYALKDFIDIRAVNANIFVDLRYADTNNFLNQRVYLKISKAYLNRDVAERLNRCQQYLTSIDSGLHLLVYDALRPVSVQKRMWTALDSIPPSRRGAYVSNPINKSLHNYGAAVDVTICTDEGIPLDMGAGFDDFREIAYPSKEMYYFTKGELTEEHLNNRRLLRKVMRKEGFRNLPTEWWHFNACSRSDAANLYTILEEEL